MEEAQSVVARAGGGGRCVESVLGGGETVSLMELRTHCERQIEAQAGLPDDPVVTLRLQRSRSPRSDRVRLTPRSGPFGQLLTTRPGRGGQGVEVVARFEAEAVLGWLDRQIRKALSDGG